MDYSSGFSLLEDGKTFVEPEMIPVLASDVVTSPRVSNFVGCYVNLGFIASDNCWRGKSKKWVFHTTHWERWWKNQNAVVAPNIWNLKIVFNGVKHGFEIFKFFGNKIHVDWLCNNSDPSTKRSILEVTNCNGDEV